MQKVIDSFMDTKKGTRRPWLGESQLIYAENTEKNKEKRKRKEDEEAEKREATIEFGIGIAIAGDWLSTGDAITIHNHHSVCRATQ